MSDLIEKWEQETGQRVDDDNSLAMAGIMGSIARMMGKSKFGERDDLAVGVLIQRDLDPEHQRREKQREAELEAFIASLK
jgi:hypothetical protein